MIAEIRLDLVVDASDTWSFLRDIEPVIREWGGKLNSFRVTNTDEAPLLAQ